MLTSLSLKFNEFKAKNDVTLIFMRIIVLLSSVLCFSSVLFGNYTHNNPKYYEFNHAISQNADFKCSLVASIAVTIPLFLDLTLDAIYFPSVDRHIFERLLFAVSIVIIAIVPLGLAGVHHHDNAQAYIATNNIQNIIMFYCSIAICYKIYPHIWTPWRANALVILWCFIQIWGSFFFNSTGEAASVSYYTYSTILHFCNLVFIALAVVTSYEIYKNTMKRKEEAGFMYLSGSDSLALLFIYGPICFSVLLYIWVILIRNVPVLTHREAVDLTITVYLTCLLTVVMVVIPSRMVRFEVVNVKHALETKKSIARHVYHEMRTPLNMVVMGLELLSSTINSLSTMNTTLEQLHFEGTSHNPYPNPNPNPNQNIECNPNPDCSDVNVQSNPINQSDLIAYFRSLSTDVHISNNDRSDHKTLSDCNDNKKSNIFPMEQLKSIHFHQMSVKTEEAHEIMDNVMISCGHTVEILNDMLQFEHLESNGLLLDLQPCSILPFIEQIAKPFMVVGNRKGLRMRIIDRIHMNGFTGVSGINSKGTVLMNSQSNSSVMPIEHDVDDTKDARHTHRQRWGICSDNGVGSGSIGSDFADHDNEKFSASDMKCVNIDAVKIAQVIRNFLSNALKYTESGSINIVIKLVQPVVSYKITPTLFRDSVFGRLQRSWYALTCETMTSVGEYMPSIPSMNTAHPATILPSRVEFANTSSVSVSSVTPLNQDMTNPGGDDRETAYHTNTNTNTECNAKKGLFINRDTNGTMVRIAITDTGGGISHANIKQLFGDVVQFNAAEVQGGGDSGFGLKIAKGILNLHGGSVGVSSNGVGKGSTFFIEIPLYILEQSTQYHTKVDANGIISVVANKSQKNTNTNTNTNTNYEIEEDVDGTAHVNYNDIENPNTFANDPNDFNGPNGPNGANGATNAPLPTPGDIYREALRELEESDSRDELYPNTGTGSGSGALLNTSVHQKVAFGGGTRTTLWDRISRGFEYIVDLFYIPPHFQPTSDQLDSNGDILPGEYDYIDMIPPSSFLQSQEPDDSTPNKNGWYVNGNHTSTHTMGVGGTSTVSLNNVNAYSFTNHSLPGTTHHSYNVDSSNAYPRDLRRILIVDPSLVCRRLLSKVLISMDRSLEINEADDGRSCVELVSQHRKQMINESMEMGGRDGEELYINDYYDVIILDSMVCTISGSENSNSIELRKGSDIPIIRDNSSTSSLVQPYTGCGYRGLIIGLVGSVDKRDVDALLTAGADIVIPKPLDTRVLLETLKRYQMGLLVGGFQGKGNNHNANYHQQLYQ